MVITDLKRWLKTTDINEVKMTAFKLEGVIEELKIDFNHAHAVGDEGTARDLFDEIREKTQLYRVMRGYFDILFFAYEYFSEDKNELNETNLIPKGVTIETAPDFHRELCSKLDELNTVKPTKNIGWGAPRGSGKSAYLSNIQPIHSVVYGTRKYVLIISETISMSQNFLEFVSTNLKSNAKLREDFGELLSPNKAKNPEDNQMTFVTFTDCRVQASSMGGQLRGSRHKNTRPDLILCDDIESSKNTNTQELREKNLHWFNTVIVPLGDIEKTAIIYMGTLVHGQGLLPDVLSRADYDSKIYSSIKSEPIHQDLWDKVELMLRDIDNPNRLQEAETFYYANKDLMDEGVEVLWADRFSYFSLVKKKVEVGSRAFASEYLNLPSDAESAVFREDSLYIYTDNDLFDNFGKQIPMDVVGFYDIAMGKNKRSDYNSIHMIGRDRRTGAIYVLESWNKKCTPSEALEKCMELIQKHKPRVFGVETINAQFEIFRMLQSQVIKQGLYHTTVRAVNPTAKKEERIEALEPLFEQGVVRTKKEHRLLHEMLLQYPNHNHDDAPDCLASAINLLRVNRKKGYFYKPEGV